MSRRRRAVLLLGLSLVLGGLAASDVSRREAALERRLGPSIPVAVARSALAPGTRIPPDRVATREVPARFAPPGAFATASEVVGLRAAVPVAPGTYLTPGLLDDGAATAGPGPELRPGERVADIVAVASLEAVLPGTRVDVLVTREPDRGGGQTILALEGVEVLSVAPAPEETATAPTAGPGAGAPRVAAALRVTLRQAVYLAAAQSFAREVRLLPRAPADRRRGAAGLTVDSGLG